MRHKEIKLPTTQCEVIEECSCSSTSWGSGREDRSEERGAHTHTDMCIYKEQQNVHKNGSNSNN